MSPPPPFPYAPRRRRPLSLWNPLDYLVLLYWVFYFPQALRWYVETFSELPVNTGFWQAVRQDAVQRRLALQGLWVMIVSLYGLALLFSGLGFKGNGLALVMTVGVAVGVLVGRECGVVDFVALVVASGVVSGVAVVMAGWAGIVALVMAVGVAVGVSAGVAAGEYGGGTGWWVRLVVLIVARLVMMPLLVLLPVMVALVVALFIVAGDMSVFNPLGIALLVELFTAVGMVAAGVTMLRPDAVLLGLLPSLLQPSKQLAIILQRVSSLPIWGLHRRLMQQLMEDWRRGLNECEGLLRYSLQFGPVIAAIQDMLKNTPDELLLSRIADWCSMPLHDWDAVSYQSASLQALIKQEFWDKFFIVPRRWRPKVVVTLYYDTPARAACAGFWLVHKGKLAEAADAFAVVRHLPHGEELYANAQALVAAANCQTLEQIAFWQPLSPQPGELLRPQVCTACDSLAEVAKDIDLVAHARSTRQRNSALNRASGRLHGFSAELTKCPTPERPHLEKIAAQWLEIILACASAVGSLEVRESVASPYIVGAPVPAARLAGLQDVFALIEAAWAKLGQRDSLVIFGHRRMGKTSIARNVPYFCCLGDDTRLAFLNLQTVDWNEGLSDFCHAIALALWEADPDRLNEPAPEDYEQHPLATLRRWLTRLEQFTPPRRYILMLDEYELLEEKLPDTVAGDRTALLRGLTQQHPWLALGLVGLHSLKERSASLREAIFGWRPIPVGLMDRDAFADMLQIEDDAFPLEYSLDTINWAYQLTGGQPFLGQLLGDSLVQRFNQQLKQQLEPPAPTFTAADVDAVVDDPRFYTNGYVYFNGIWAQAGEAPPGQQALLRILADHRDGLDRNTWREQHRLDPTAFDAAVEALEGHDVVTCESGVCRYSVELMRRWVASEGYENRSHG